MAVVKFMGIVQRVEDIQQVNEKFSKIEIYCDEVREDNRENILKLQGINAMTEGLSKLRQGERVMFECFIEGRIWIRDDKEMYFLNLNVKSFRSIGVSASYTPPQQSDTGGGRNVGESIKAKDVPTLFGGDVAKEDYSAQVNDMDDDDLPF